MLNLFPLWAGWAVPSPTVDQIWSVVPIWCPGQVQQIPSGDMEGDQGQVGPNQTSQGERSLTWPYGEKGYDQAPTWSPGGEGA